MIKACIFDIDGTLLDSMPIWRDLGARYLESLGITPEHGLSDILFPMTAGEGAAYLKEHYGLQAGTDDVLKGLSDITEDFYRNEVRAKKGAFDFVSGLYDRGIPMVLATVGDPVLGEAALRRLGMLGFFRKTFVCDDYGTTKREPLIYLKCAGYLGTEPGVTAVFEDVLQAVRTASQAGFITCAIEDADSAGDREEIRKTADHYFEDFVRAAAVLGDDI
ncbi:MAG: HAD family hydrolase [Anaerovoracaceae bacterium]